ncbi:hypothetical protein Clacol_008219 [Clathrus columnatus]|uniref:U3 small nucleolar RNA-associated protein 13 C-terminal domain-containing protein n=1 Tax=Clathrus columnatus TaxID=1419009 RepID=A0AAV5AJX3_9AGAM|nr:hypothetical protein Clacol_008219 [Clathrus columnatus]
MVTESSRFRQARVIPPLHTGGPVIVTPDGMKIVTCVEEDILITEVETGIEICRLQSDSTPATAMCISPSGKHLSVFTSSLSLRVYDLFSPPCQLLPPMRHVARAHDATVHVATVDQVSLYLASGAADGIVKIWDLRQGFVTHILRGHGGLISSLVFLQPKTQTIPNPISLVTGSTDNQLRIFRLSSSNGANIRPHIILEGHSSVPRGIALSSDGRWLISGGRDSVLLVWDLMSVNSVKQSVAPLRTIPTLERIEGLEIIDYEDHGVQHKADNSINFPSLKVFTVGEQGRLKIWDIFKGSIISTLEGANTSEVSQNEIQGILSAQYLRKNNLVICLFADQNIFFYSLDSHSIVRRLIGFNDEITDAIFLKPTLSSRQDSLLALTTNSSLIRIYSMNTFDTQVLAGHTNIVMTIDKSADGTVFATGSKDSTARLWAFKAPSSESLSGGNWHCIAVCEGHTQSIGSVALARSATETGFRFICTASQDRTIKMWDLSCIPTSFALSTQKPIKINSLTTIHAHEKDINALDISVDDSLLVSGSQDKTVKVYSIIYKPGHGELRLLGTCKGHKRGVWSVQFSRAKNVLITGSGDKTIKLWDLRDFSCLKTFEGHTNSILRLRFGAEGKRILSAASDGLVKIWDVESERCLATLDNHQDKVWALALNSDEKTLVSGGADSMITFWQDFSEEDECIRETERHDTVLRQQNLENYIALKDHKNAILTALAINHPTRLLSLLRSTYVQSKEDPSIRLEVILRCLPTKLMGKLLSHLQMWNVALSNADIAQVILHAIVKFQRAEEVLNSLKAVDEIDKPTASPKEFLESTIPYTKRHLKRLQKLEQESWVLDFVLGEMDDRVLLSNNSFDGIDES